MGSTKEKRFVVYTHRRHTSERVATRATTCGGRGGLSRRPPSFLISRLNDSLEKKSQRRRRRDMGWKKRRVFHRLLLLLLLYYYLTTTSPPPPFDPVKWKKKNTVPPLLLLLSLAICDARYKRRRRKSSFVFLMCVSCLQSPRRPRTWTRSPISSFYFKHFFILYSVKSSGQ